MDVQKSSEAFEVIREIMDDEALLEFFGNASAILGGNVLFSYVFLQIKSL